MIVKGREHWTAMFLNYTEPVSIQVPTDSNNVFTTCTLNLWFPRKVIIEQFKRSLSNVRKAIWQKGFFISNVWKVRGKPKARLRLRRRNGAIDVDYYVRAFSVYDRVEKIKAKNQRADKKWIRWKRLSPDMNEKQARDAYAKAKDLINGGFRLIS